MSQAIDNQIPPGWLNSPPTSYGQGLEGESSVGTPLKKTRGPLPAERPVGRSRSWMTALVLFGLLALGGIVLIPQIAGARQPVPLTDGTYRVDAKGTGDGRLICFLPPWAKSDPSYEYSLTMNLTRADVSENTIHIYSTVTFSEVRNFGWGKGLSPQIYIEDRNGNKFPEIGAGGIYGRDVPPGSFVAGKTYQGWESFRVPLNSQPFLYHSWLLRQPIQFTLNKS